MNKFIITAVIVFALIMVDRTASYLEHKEEISAKAEAIESAKTSAVEAWRTSTTPTPSQWDR